MGTNVQVHCVYNYPPWGIRKITINDMAVLLYVPMFLQENLEELDKKFLLVQFLSSVSGKTLLLASDYLIISRIRRWGGWCLMSRIYMTVEVQDTVIQQVLSISVPSPLPMMEDEAKGDILKSDGQKENDADPTVALWDSWFYRSFKAYRAMLYPLE